jgi:cell division protein FtsL
MVARHLKVVLLALLLVTVALVVLTMRHMPRAIEEASKTAGFSHCRQVYLDVGSNIGVQVRKLFEPSRYPHAEVLPLFDQYFGVRRQSQQLCAIGVELNPSHTARLRALEEHYRHKCNYSVHFLTETAAANHNGTVDFWSDGDLGNLEWGASTRLLSSSRPRQTVRALDLARFILDELLPFASTLVMKLDVEGAEYELLPRLLATGALCAMDLVFIEQHPRELAASQAQADAFEHAKALVRDALTGCRVRLSMLDDESYLHDADDTLNTC